METRYVLPFLSGVFFGPLKVAVWFIVIYFGFFSVGNTGIGNLNKENYILFILLGSIFQIFFTIATSDFPNKFFYEKYWKTIQGILIAPINSLKFVFGLSLSEIIKTSFAFFVLSAIALSVFPIPLYKFALIVVIILSMFVGLMFVGLIRATFILINENINTIFEYIFLAVGFLSCFYYPIETFPRFIRPLIYINPVYQAIDLIRNIWLDHPISPFSIYWILIWIPIFCIFGIFMYNKLMKSNDIQGY